MTEQQPTGRLIGYARVSTPDQSLDMQIQALIKAGVDPQHIYSETISGALAKRPRLEAALKAADEGDTLVVWKLDRLGRSTLDLLKRLEWMGEHKIGFRSITEQIDTTTPIGKLLLLLLSAISQFERDLIAERSREGMRNYIAKGGRVGKEREFTPDKVKAAHKAIIAGKTIAEIADEYGVTATTVYNYIPGAVIRKLRARKR